MPCNVAHTAPATYRHPTTKAASHGACTTTVRQRCDLTFASEIPNDRIAGAARRRQCILDMVIPSESRDLIELRAARPWRVRLARVFEVPDVNLSVDCARRKQVGLDWVEVEPAHRTGVRGVAKDERFRRTVGRITTEQTRCGDCNHSLRILDDLRGVPDIELAILHTRDEHTARTTCVCVAPCQTVEPARC